jgi:hypothetical protein
MAAVLTRQVSRVTARTCFFETEWLTLPARPPLRTISQLADRASGVDHLTAEVQAAVFA